MIEETSLQAYIKMRDDGRLNANETIIYDLLKQHPYGLTNFEISKKIGWSINRVTGRTNGLYKKGKIIVLKAARYCTETKQKHNVNVIQDYYNRW